MTGETANLTFMQNELHPILASSTDPTQLSARITGILIGASSIILGILASVFHVTINPTDWVSLATAIGTFIGALYALVGVLRAVTIKFGRLK